MAFERALLVAATMLGLIGCAAGEPAVSRQAQADVVRGVVDSIFPLPEEIRRFKTRHDISPVTQLADVARSRDALVETFIGALELNDTIALRALVIDAGEFINLYYPTSIYARPPYRQSPEVTWLLLQQHSEKGLRRLRERYAGTVIGREYRCGDARVEGKNRFWDDCAVTLAAGAGSSRAKLFGSIVERDGRLKFVSFANDL